MVPLLALTALAHAVTPDAADSLLNDPDRAYALRLHAEVGFIAPLSHTVQFGRDGTEIDYLKEGGQDNLFPLLRPSADLDLGTRHTITFLAQPFDLRTSALPERDLVVDGATFAKDSPVDFRYGFTFYRASYLYNLLADPDRELGIGLSLQIRNADISFSSSDGEVARFNRNIGPVPILKVRGRVPLGEGGWWFGSEADGFYAPVSYLNGDDNEVVGAILDSSLRTGVALRSGTDAFLNLRYLGGGAVGETDTPTYPADGYSRNWLHVLTVSLGLTLR